MIREAAELVLQFLAQPFAVPIGFVVGFLSTYIADAISSFVSRHRTRLIDDEAYRKLDAKKHNEHIKLIGSLFNTLGAAVLGAAFIVPYIGGHANPDQVDLRWVAAGLALPVAGHIALRFMKRSYAGL